MKEWLALSVEGASYPFVVSMYAEKVGWASAGGAGEMAVLLDESTASPEFIERMSDRIGWDKAKARSSYIAEMQPTNDSVKKGKFGEVLHGAILEQFCGMVVVHHRHRYSPDPDTSPPGLDIIALKPRDGGSGEVIVYAETKLRINADSGVIAKALGQLARTGGVNEPPSLKSTLQALSSADPLLLNRIIAAVDDRESKPHYRIGVVLETKHWSDSYLRRIKDDPIVQRMDMAVDVVQIDALGDLIKESYANVGRSDA